MAHTIYAQQPTRMVEHADYVFHVHRDKQKLGRVLISKGGVVFAPFHKGRKHHRKVWWHELTGFLVNSGRPLRVPRNRRRKKRS